MSNYILAHDLGTSGNKATLYDTGGKLCGSTVCKYPTYYPKSQFVEQEPQDWWKAVCLSTQQIIRETGIKPQEILCVAFSGQMLGCLLVDARGNPLGRSIIWADMRAEKQARFIEQCIDMKTFYRITGHRISSSYSGPKLLWIKDNLPDVYKEGYKMLQAKDYIIFKLTGYFGTDYSDASSTNLFDLEDKRWSPEIVKAANIRPDILPEAHASTETAGYVTCTAADATGLQEGTPVIFGGGDGSCAAVGAGVCNEGEFYNVIGSSSWVATASQKPILDDKLRTFNWVHLDQNLYSPCGTMQAAGYSYSWLKNTLCQAEIDLAKKRGVNAETLIEESVVKSPAGAGNLLFLPYLLGERSPRWNPNARGAFIGASIRTTREDILRSVLEGIGYNLKVILSIFDAAFKPEKITVIGGGAQSNVWMQILADIWQKEIEVPRYLEEATSMGAAICGGVGTHVFKDFNIVKKFNPVENVLKPNPENKKVYDRLYAIFNQTYEGLLPVYDALASCQEG